MCKLLLSRGASLDWRDAAGRDPEAQARSKGHTTIADLLAAVRAAGGWLPYVNAPRKARPPPAPPGLRERGRAAPSSSVSGARGPPQDARRHLSLVLTFWHSARDD
ncbi:hypothetical protein JL721_5670 [Aureococcus anophagefferens]|nr:hypothetical protein JL721_5670 [Aureococcus anophagefferens]